MKKIWLVIIMMLGMLIPLVNAAQQELSNPFKQGSCIQLTQSCDNCTSVNFTGVTYPNGVFELLGIQGENHGTIFNQSFCNTSQVGTYIINTLGDLDGKKTVGNYNFYINPSGMTFNNVLYDYLFFALITIILYLILFMAFKNIDKNMAMLSSFGILALGVYIFVNGIANLNNIYTNAFSIINIGLGAYVLIRSAIELIQEEWDGETSQGE